MSFQKLLKLVDDRSKNSVFGYIRQSRDDAEQMAIPMMIQYCCLKYYFINEYFKKCGDNLRISNNPKIVTSIEKTWTFEKHFATGNIVIDPANESITKYVWTIRVLELVYLGDIYFGIKPLDDSYNDSCMYRLELSEGRIKIGFHGCNVGFGNNCAKNDILIMSFNVKNETLVFHHNAKNLGNIPYEIDMERKYRMIVNLYGDGSSVELVRYQETYN